MYINLWIFCFAEWRRNVWNRRNPARTATI